MPDFILQMPFSPDLLRRLLIAIMIFLGFLVFRKILTALVFNLVLKFTKKTKGELDSNLVLAFENPFRFFLIILGLYLALSSLGLSITQQHTLDVLLRSFLIITITWGLYNLGDTYSGIFPKIIKKLGLDWDPLLFPFLSKVFRLILIALALSIIIQEWGYNIEGFIAGLGLGGLAFALAAQDTVANIFGGIVIIAERPFSIGDWVLTPEVEGTVLDITFRSTKFRTFGQAVTTVPNSTLANGPITNWSRMGKRRINFHLRIPYDTPKEKIEKALLEIKKMLQNHPEIHQETIFVNFDAFGKDSIELLIYFFTKTIIWGEFLKVKEDVNFKILNILENEEISVALPITSIHYSDSPAKKNDN